MKISSGPIADPIWTSENFILSPAHKSMIDVRDDLALLIAQGGADHDEDHRAAAPGLVVDFLDRGAQRDLVAGANRRDEFHVLARIEALLAVARDVLKEMPS